MDTIGMDTYPFVAAGADTTAGLVDEHDRMFPADRRNSNPSSGADV